MSSEKPVKVHLIASQIYLKDVFEYIYLTSLGCWFFSMPRIAKGVVCLLLSGCCTALILLLVFRFIFLGNSRSLLLFEEF